MLGVFAAPREFPRQGMHSLAFKERSSRSIAADGTKKPFAHRWAFCTDKWNTRTNQTLAKANPCSVLSARNHWPDERIRAGRSFKNAYDDERETTGFPDLARLGDRGATGSRRDQGM